MIHLLLYKEREVCQRHRIEKSNYNETVIIQTLLDSVLDTSAWNSVWIIGFFACLLTTRLPFPSGLLPVNFIKNSET